MTEKKVVVFEHDEKTPLGPNVVDGMADWIAEAEANGYEGEHVFDASVEDPPHPFWNAKEGRCYTDAELAERLKNEKP